MRIDLHCHTKKVKTGDASQTFIIGKKNYQHLLKNI